MFVPLHGLGGAQDLPLPAPLAISGGVAALVVSFCVLAFAWRRPRYTPSRPGRPMAAGLATFLDSPWTNGIVRAVGLLFFAYVGWALFAGQDLATNPALGTFYVLVWVGIVPFSLVFGRIARALSPIRTLNILLARAMGTTPDKGVLRYPEWLGRWPAAIALFAFVWQELVNPDSTVLGSVRLWLSIYAAVMLVGAAVFGDRWLENADPFEVYSDLVARLSPWGRVNGQRVWRSPLADLADTPAGPGLVAVVAVLFGSTAYDSFHEQLSWRTFTESHPDYELLLHGGGLILACLIVGLSFTAAAMMTGIGSETRRSQLPGLLVHSVVPIIVGYMTAHYLSYFSEVGQATVQQLSDPLSRGDNYLGTAGLTPNLWLSLHPTFLACTKVVAVVLGHIVGVIAAHDRALSVLPKRHHVTGQLGMLVVMVCYTGAGLWLLFGS